MGKNVLSSFGAKYPPARKAVTNWVQVVEAAQWNTLTDLKSTFTSADYVAPYVVFNVGGNKYRVITLVEFALKLVQIEHAFTHEQYNRWQP